MTAPAPTEPNPAPHDDLFGHPRGLTVLFAAEMWERFSYFGNAALIVLYMVKYLLDPARIDTVLGIGVVKAAFDMLFGPLDPQPFASQLFGFYTGFAYFMPVLGGLVADRWLGQRRTVIAGGALMALGHFLMAFESLFLLALLLSSCSASAPSNPTSQRRSARSTRRATTGATAPIRSSMSASTSARSWRRWSAARSRSPSAGTGASPRLASAC